jgi:hypothetical protein
LRSGTVWDTGAAADSDDLVPPFQMNALYDNWDSENGCLKRERKVVLDHRVEAHQLFRLVVTVDSGFLD